MNILFLCISYINTNKINFLYKETDTFKKPMLPVSSSLLLPCNVPELEMWAKPLHIKYKNILEVLTVIPFLPTLVS